LPLMIGLVKRPDRVILAANLQLLLLERNSPALVYLQRIRDEAHRFARQYHILLRQKKLKQLVKAGKIK
jgi:excinuclease ABC subunit C